jgi:chromosome segregation ATPase
MPTPQEVAAYKLTKEMEGYTKGVREAKAQLSKADVEAKSLTQELKDLDAKTKQQVKALEELVANMTEARDLVLDYGRSIQEMAKARVVSENDYDTLLTRYQEGAKSINELMENLSEKEEKAQNKKYKDDKKVQGEFELAKKALDKGMNTYSRISEEYKSSMDPKAVASTASLLPDMRNSLAKYKEFVAALDARLKKMKEDYLQARLSKKW